MPVEMATGCPSCGRESGVSMPGSVSQPLLDAFGYQNPVTLAAALRIGIDARIGGYEDVPATQDEELQGLRVSRRN